jgi:hypothetical protein
VPQRTVLQLAGRADDRALAIALDALGLSASIIGTMLAS